MKILTHWQISTMTSNDILTMAFGGLSVEAQHYLFSLGTYKLRK